MVEIKALSDSDKDSETEAPMESKSTEEPTNTETSTTTTTSSTTTRTKTVTTTTTRTTTAANDNPRHVMVIVLGDLGRSPRMQYHALSLLEMGNKVSLVGYQGEPLIPDLEEYRNDRKNTQLSVIRFRVPTPKILQGYLFIYLLWRIVSLTLWLAYAMFVTVANGLHQNVRVDCIIVQNPPALPLLLVSYLYCRVEGLIYGNRPGFIIDWHNLGFSMLSSSNPIFGQVAKMYERSMAPLATGHFTVTTAMKTWLEKEFNLSPDSVSVLHDCPPALFRPLDAKEQHEVLLRLHSDLTWTCPRSWIQHLVKGSQTLFTDTTSKGEIIPRRGRPALLTSSTSWTPDEDFGILLKAMELLDAKIKARESDLKVLVVVTGKGPQKAMYEEKMSQLKLENVAMQTIWLEPADYPKLLACGDAGVSLHTSTSGLDLPMKILDLFGCQVPVCATNFACLKELVEDDENSRTFEGSQELADQLWYMLKPLGDAGMRTGLAPHSFGDLARYSETLQDRPRWHENWTKQALPMVEKVCPY